MFRLTRPVVNAAGRLGPAVRLDARADVLLSGYQASRSVIESYVRAAGAVLAMLRLLHRPSRGRRDCGSGCSLRVQPEHTPPRPAVDPCPITTHSPMTGALP